jgi:hypothetical protein
MSSATPLVVRAASSWLLETLYELARLPEEELGREAGAT